MNKIPVKLRFDLKRGIFPEQPPKRFQDQAIAVERHNVTGADQPAIPMGASPMHRPFVQYKN